ncbi:UDP-N-acetylglucosamine 1-carboxyvinyltransferase [Candidatus Wolfebacteria bacterium]|nr:MAG: UDP-N-acetylglucosamine 1-carboxyvinyltransferase [Candidatus Wolfebacteria bacterium]
MNDSFLIKGQGGSKKLEGSISVGGAKNAVLKVMASSLLFDDAVTLANVPDIEDVSRAVELLVKLGAHVTRDTPETLTIDPSSILSSTLDPEIAQTMRGSIVFTGSLLARGGSVTFPNPGGCDLGERPIDQFIVGFEKFGATVVEDSEQYSVSVAEQGLIGADFFFRIQSHTGTETLMMTAVLAQGTTVLRNCALEPEVKSLADFLNECGAQITGAGTTTITIIGSAGKLLHAGRTSYTTIPDRVEAVSFMVLGALSARELRIENCDPTHFEIATEILRGAGVDVVVSGDSVVVRAPEQLMAVNIRTHEYPGLPTDVQPQLGVFSTQCNGTSTIFETIFGNRLVYLKDLERMGADISIEDCHRAIVRGPSELSGIELVAPDLRAGLAFVIAAVIAKGESTIRNAYYIDRGYANIEERLRGIGVDIKRV